jgi:hypothetical protein
MPAHATRNAGENDCAISRGNIAGGRGLDLFGVGP